MANTEGQIMLS